MPRTSTSDRPFSRSVISDALAWEMAQPWPLKATSSITPSRSRRASPTRSPQSGFSAAHTILCSPSCSRAP